MEQLSYSSVYYTLRNWTNTEPNAIKKAEEDPLVRKFISEKSSFLYNPITFYTSTNHKDSKIKELSEKHNVNADEVARIVKVCDDRLSEEYYDSQISTEKRSFALVLQHLATDSKYLSQMLKNKKTILNDSLQLLEHSIEVDVFLKIVTVVVINNNKDIGTDFVLKWLEYLSKNTESPIAIINTLLILGLNTVEGRLDDLIENKIDISKITEFLISKKIQSPLLNYFWSFVLYSFEQQQNKVQYFVATSSKILEYLNQFELDSFYNSIMMSFWKVALHFISLTPETCKCIAKFLNGAPSDIVESFLIDKEFESKMDVLRQKIPLVDEALLPLIYLGSSNPDFANYELRSCNTFAVRTKLGKLDYDLVDDDSGIIVLKSELLVNPPLDKSVLLPIPKNTKGKLIQLKEDDDEVLLIFLYNFNGWSLLGRLFKCCPSEYLVPLINLLTSNINTPLERATEVLQQCSAFIEEDDIVAVIFNIFEKSLQSKDIEISCAILKFIQALLKNFPYLVWSHLVRSQLLDKSGFLLAITSSELLACDFKFTLHLIDMVKDLYTDTFVVDSEIPKKTKEEIISKFIEHFVNVYESYQYWKFLDINDRFKLGASLCDFFINTHKNLNKAAINLRFTTSLINSILSIQQMKGDEQFMKFIDNHLTLAGLLVEVNLVESSLIEHSTDIANIYMKNYELKISILDLLTKMVTNASQNHPSILSYLNNAETFTTALKYDLKYPLSNFTYMNEFYKFFSALLTNGQSGLCILFLTGQKASKSLELKASDDSLFHILKDQILQDLPDEVFINLLKVVSLSLNTWHDEHNLFSRDEKVLSKLVSILSTYQPSTSFEKYDLIANVTETCALLYYTSKHSAIDTLFNDKNLPNTVESIFDVDETVDELELKLQAEFNQNWPKLQLTQDVDFLDKSLVDDQKWLEFKPKLIEMIDKLKLKYYKEYAAKTWGALLTSYVKKCKSPLNDNFLSLVLVFLKNDSGNLLIQRLELTFYILYSFFKTKKSIADESLIQIIVQIQKTLERIDFLDLLVNSKDSSFYRTCLRSVLLVLSMVSNGSEFVEKCSNDLLKFLDMVVGKGTHLILNKLLIQITKNEEDAIISEKIQDLLTILAIFNKVKDLKPSASFNISLAHVLSESGMLKSISNLYSNAQLMKDDPILLADISLTFVAELCKVEPVAERLVANGLYAVLLESPVSLIIQNQELTAENNTKLYNLWLNGILSLVLQLLGTFGTKVMNETCLFVEYFGKQISFCITSWADFKNINVSSLFIQETSQIILLYKMMSALNYQDFMENISLPGFNNDTERNELFNNFKKLLTHPKFLNSKLMATNLAEQKSLESGETRSLFVKKITQDIKELQTSVFSNEI